LVTLFQGVLGKRPEVNVDRNFDVEVKTKIEENITVDCPKKISRIMEWTIGQNTGRKR